MAGWLQGVLGRITGAHQAVDWDDVEAAIWQSDLGAPTATAIMESLRAKGLALHAGNVFETARAEAAKYLPERGAELTPSPDGPVVILMVGVNGTGKTTSSAKLAALMKARGHSVLLCAADTFRAAAVEQLRSWGDKLGVEVVSSEYGADPAALCHDALAKAMAFASASWQRAAGSAPYSLLTTSTPSLSPHDLSCSTAAARKVSAAQSRTE